MSKWTVENMPNQTGRVVVITGANSGLGLASALAFARKGAQVIMACRNPQKAQTAYQEIKQTVPNSTVEVMALDLGSLESVRQFAATFKARYDRLDILMNNAGIMAIQPRQETQDGFEAQFGTNHLGHFALTGLLLDVILNTPNSRIVNVSSGYYRGGKIHFEDVNLKQDYKRWKAYGQTKLANILFTRELQRRFNQLGTKTIAVACHPGYTATNLQYGIGDKGITRIIVEVMNGVLAQSVEMGVLPQLYAATAPDVNGNEFFGPEKGMRGYPVRESLLPHALDDAAAAKLWTLSEKMTGVQYPIAETAGAA